MTVKRLSFLFLFFFFGSHQKGPLSDGQVLGMCSCFSTFSFSIYTVCINNMRYNRADPLSTAHKNGCAVPISHQYPLFTPGFLSPLCPASLWRRCYMAYIYPAKRYCPLVSTCFSFFLNRYLKRVSMMECCQSRIIQETKQKKP